MAGIALSDSARRKLKRRLEKYAGMRLRGRSTIEARLSFQGQRLRRSFAENEDVFANLDAAIAWQNEQKTLIAAAEQTLQKPPVGIDPNAPQNMSSNSPFADWTVTDLLKKVLGVLVVKYMGEFLYNFSCYEHNLFLKRLCSNFAKVLLGSIKYFLRDGRD